MLQAFSVNSGQLILDNPLHLELSKDFFNQLNVSTEISVKSSAYSPAFATLVEFSRSIGSTIRAPFWNSGFFDFRRLNQQTQNMTQNTTIKNICLKKINSIKLPFYIISFKFKASLSGL